MRLLKHLNRFKIFSCLHRTLFRIMSSSAIRGDGLLKIFENSPKRLERIKYLNELYASNNFELRIAGGAVRDILTGKEPSDIDLATTALPEQSLEILENHSDLMRIIVTESGFKHGTVAVKFKEVELDFKRIKLSKESESITNDDPAKPKYDNESPFEITTLRCDATTDGRHAEVKFINDWKLDAERRDLTINAMFLTLDEGKLIDYFDGQSDLTNGVIRFVGNAELRMKEDYLRILRYFRFWSRYGRNKSPDEETLAEIVKNLDGLDQISGERIWQEIKKTLHLPCVPVIKLMLNSKLLMKVGVLDSKLDNYNFYVDTVLEELKLVESYLCNFKNDELLPIIRFATTIQTLEMFENAFKRLKFSNIEKSSILYILENRSHTPTLKDIKSELAMAATPSRQLLRKKTRALLIYKGMFNILGELDSWEVPEFPLSGGAIVEEFKKKHLLKKHQDKIKYVLEFLKKQWIASDYKLSKEDLIRELSTEIDKYAVKLDANDGTRND